MTPYETGVIILLIIIAIIVGVMAYSSYQVYKKVQLISNEISDQIQGIPNPQQIGTNVANAVGAFVNALKR